MAPWIICLTGAWQGCVIQGAKAGVCKACGIGFKIDLPGSWGVSSVNKDLSSVPRYTQSKESWAEWCLYFQCWEGKGGQLDRQTDS